MDYPASETIGFKLTAGGTLSWIYSWVISLDLGQVVGLIVAVCGITLQLSSWLRGRRQEQRDIAKHEAEMIILRNKIDTLKEKQ